MLLKKYSKDYNEKSVAFYVIICTGRIISSHDRRNLWVIFEYEKYFNGQYRFQYNNDIFIQACIMLDIQLAYVLDIQQFSNIYHIYRENITLYFNIARLLQQATLSRTSASRQFLIIPFANILRMTICKVNFNTYEIK